MITRNATYGIRLPLAGLVLAAAWLAPASFAQGPLVAVPHCTVISEGCGLDPATPQLDPAACAVALAKQLDRRRVRAEVVGPGAVVCGEGSDALILEGTLTAQCPGRADNEMLMDKVYSVRMRLGLLLRDCFSGEEIGSASTQRAIESGRRTLARDAIEELGHHVAERRVRRLYPRTPVAWIRADVGGERVIESAGGGIDIEGNEINDFLDEVALDEEEYASRINFEIAYHPWSTQNTRLGIGLELMQIRAEDDGMVDPVKTLGRDPNSPASFDPNVPHHVDMKLGVVGIYGRVGYGVDITRNQRISVAGSVGYYLLGTSLMRAEIIIEGLPADAYRLRGSAAGLGGEFRYTWRFTPHLAFLVAYGFNYLDYRDPNRLHHAAHFPFDVEFSGQTARVGLGGRF
jgi:hypothetical protein